MGLTYYSSNVRSNKDSIKRRGANEVDKIVERSTLGYTHHSRIINYKEAQDIFGKDKFEFLKPNSREWALIWEFYINNRNISDLLGVLKYLDKVKIETK